MNNVVLIGRLTAKPELNYTKDQIAIAKFTIAVDRQTKDGGADFVRVTAFGRRAENICRYMDKGRQIAVQGRIQTGSYKDKEGKTVYTTDVIIDHDEFLGGKNDAPAERVPLGMEDVQDFGTFSTATDDMPF
jgi:single-strand DNA-binding protein